MAMAARDRIAKILRGDTPTASSVWMAEPAKALSLHVGDCGYVPLPVTRPRARMLIDLARPDAPVHDEISGDRATRDTWEISPHLVHAEWDADTLREILATARDELGLPNVGELIAELSSLLIYGQGRPATPTEAAREPDDVLGTLMVTLPSTHRGGDLVVGDGDGRTSQEASREGWSSRSSGSRDLSAVAFRAGCRPEIREVTFGYRIALVYDLRLPGASARADGDEGTIVELAALIREHFDPPVPMYGDWNATQPPARLAFLLDGDHASSGLSWDTLRGEDASRTALLREAASRAGCEAVLGLAEIEVCHEVSELDGPSRPVDEDREYREEEETDGYHGQPDDYDFADRADDYYRWTYEDHEDHDEVPYLFPDPDPESGGEPLHRYTHEGYQFLIKELRWSTIGLTRWPGPDGVTLEETALPLPDTHVCAATPSEDLTPRTSELRGNGLLDRSYRRAAVVMWPRNLAFANRAETNPARALREITAKAESGNVASAQTMAASLEAFWRKGPFRGSGSFARDTGEGGWPGDLLGGTLRAAVAVADPDIAAMLLVPFTITHLTNADMAPLAAAAGRYGREWTAGVLRRWFGEDRGRGLEKQQRQDWTTQRLPGLCAALRAAGDAGTEVAGQLLDLAWAPLRDDVRKSIDWTDKYQNAFTRLGECVAAVLTAAAAAGASGTRDAVAQYLRDQRDIVAALELCAVRAAAGTAAAGAPRQDGFHALAADCAARLRSWLAPVPAAEYQPSMPPR